jgi:hypothetical protein
LCASTEVICQRLGARAESGNRHPGHLDRDLAAEIPERQEDISRYSARWAQSGHWLRYESDVLNDSILDEIVLRVAARIAP